jgi:hypothetical protein
MNKLKNKIRYSLAMFVLLIGVVEGAGAAVVTHDYTGIITFVSGTLFGLSPSNGQPVHGSITYDTGLPPAYDTGTVAGYIQPPQRDVCDNFRGHPPKHRERFISDAKQRFWCR